LRRRSRSFGLRAQRLSSVFVFGAPRRNLSMGDVHSLPSSSDFVSMTPSGGGEREVGERAYPRYHERRWSHRNDLPPASLPSPFPLPSSLRHPHICLFLGASSKQPRVIVTEFMPNGSLWSYLANPANDLSFRRVHVYTQRVEGGRGAGWGGRLRAALVAHEGVRRVCRGAENWPCCVVDDINLSWWRAVTDSREVREGIRPARPVIAARTHKTPKGSRWESHWAAEGRVCFRPFQE